MHGLGFGVPVVERPRDTNAGGRGMSEFEVNRLQLRPGVPDIVMVMTVFHSCELDWFLWRNSFTEHFRHEEDDDSSDKASASEEIYQGVTSGGEHG
jgi:hypothetical protein